LQNGHFATPIARAEKLYLDASIFFPAFLLSGWVLSKRFALKSDRHRLVSLMILA